MKTVILADLHLGLTGMNDQQIIIGWIKQIFHDDLPDRVVLTGDTFEMILPIEGGSVSICEGSTCLVASIIEEWEPMFRVWRESRAQEFVFVPGEHDYWINYYPQVLSVLRAALPGKTVSIVEAFFEEESHTLIVHGHQFDYNRIFKVWGGWISCINGLTVAIDRFLSQTPDIERRVRAAAVRRMFSYWYAYGMLTTYIRVTQKIFGANGSWYANECARVFRGGDLDRWLAQQSDWQTHLVGRLVKLAALYPPLLLWLYRPFWTLLELKMHSRMRKVLAGKEYRDKPMALRGHGRIKHLITGHFHKSQGNCYQEGWIYNIGCPRLSVGGIQHNTLETFRDMDYVVLDGPSVKFHSERLSAQVSLSEFQRLFRELEK